MLESANKKQDPVLIGKASLQQITTDLQKHKSADTAYKMWHILYTLNNQDSLRFSKEISIWLEYLSNNLSML